MEFKTIGTFFTLRFGVMKDTMKYLHSDLKTINNEIIRGKWQMR